MSSTSLRSSRAAAALSVLLATTGCTRSASAGPSRDAGAALTLKLVDGVLPPGEPGVVDLTFTVEADREERPISPLVYGVNFDLKEPGAQRWGLIRSGGNRLTAYNWENNASNAGSDYLFQNDSLMGVSDEPAKPILDVIDAAASVSAPAIVTLSLADFVAADKKGDGDVRNSGPGYLSTRFRRNMAKKPAPFTPRPNADDHFVYQDELVAYLKAQRPKANLLFALDNEPELWSHTHAELFPKPVTYEDLWKRNLEFAKAAKAVWPSAEVLGFVSYGYAGFQNLQSAPDSGGRNFIEWYLDQAKDAEQRGGKRLIDYLDVHWYPEAQGAGTRIVGDNVTAPVASAREQAPRSLWDPKYEEQSWIRDAAGGPVNLLRWLQDKIDAHYPGTKLAFTEWNYGGGNHISGAIAVADVLGVFGRHGVNAATYWPLSPDEPFAYAAFRAFRNYDGRGAAFNEISIAANSSKVDLATVYASIDREDPAKLTIVAINKATTAKKAGIKISHSEVYSTAKVYLLSAATPNVVNAPELSAVATNAFKYTMPAQSISVIVPQGSKARGAADGASRFK